MRWIELEDIAAAGTADAVTMAISIPSFYLILCLVKSHYIRAV